MLGHENIFIGGADGPRLGSGVAHLEPLRHAFGYRRLQELFKGDASQIGPMVYLHDAPHHKPHRGPILSFVPLLQP
jgi:hypothetical protein